jgi:uncharacterized cupin superfamily protein
VIVLRGQPTLRTPAAEQVLQEGDVVCFPRGKDGAHQLNNRTQAPIRLLMLSSILQPEIVEYLDTGKILADDAAGRAHHARPAGTGRRRLGRRGLVDARSRDHRHPAGNHLYLRGRLTPERNQG